MKQNRSTIFSSPTGKAPEENARRKEKRIEKIIALGSFFLATMILAMSFVTSSYAESGSGITITGNTYTYAIQCAYDKDYDSLVDFKDGISLNKSSYLTIKAKHTDGTNLNASELETLVKNSKVQIKKSNSEATDITEKIINADYVIEDEGKYTLSAELVEDETIYRKTITFTVDKTAPEIKLTGQTEDNYVKSMSQLKAITTDTDVVSMKMTATCGEKKMSGESDKSSVTFDTREESSDVDEEVWNVTVTATDSSGNETKKTFEITKDNVAPEVSVAGAEDGEYYKKDLTISLSISDSAVKSTDTKVFLNGKELTGSDRLNITKEGEYTVIGSVADKAGNTSEATIHFVLDKTAPTVSFSGAKDDEHYSSPEAVIAKLSEEGTIWLSATCDGETVYPNSGRTNVNEAEFDEWGNDGVYEISAYGKDKAGNKSEIYTISVTKDSVAPVIALSGIENGKYYNKDQELSISVEEKNYASDKVTVDIEKTLNDKTEKIPYTFSSDKEISESTYTASAEGLYTITVSAIDKAGNKANVKTISFTIDKTPPKTSFSGVEGSKHYKSNPTLSISANEEAAVYYSITRDGNKVTSKNGKNKQTVLSWNKDGDYVITAYSVDLAGNKGTAVTKKFTKDSTAPKVSISGAGEGKYYNKNISLKLTTKERYYKTTKVTVEGYRQLGSKKVTLNRSYKLSKAADVNTKTYKENGTYHFTVYAVDEAGNKSAVKSISFTIDTQKPVITISIPKKVNGYNDSVTPKVTIKDDYFGTKTVSLKKTIGNNAGAVSMARSEKYGKTGGTTSYRNFAKLKDNDGVYTLSVTTKDKAGNTATKSETFTVDRFGSIFKVMKKPSGKYNQEIADDIVIKEINVGKVTSYKAEIYKDDEKIKGDVSYVTKNSYTREYTIDASNFDEDAVYRVNLVTKDSAGNTSQSQKQDKCNIWFTVDNTSPVIKYSGIEEGEIYKAEARSFTVSMTDTIKAGTMKVYINGTETNIEPVTDSEGEYTVTLHSGYNQDIKIEATDAAGNKETKEIQNVTVSSSPFAYLIAHKGVTIGVSAGIVALLAGIIILIKRKKNDKNSASGIDDDFSF